MFIKCDNLFVKTEKQKLDLELKYVLLNFLQKFKKPINLFKEMRKRYPRSDEKLRWEKDLFWENFSLWT